MKIPTLSGVRGCVQITVRGEGINRLINALAEAGIPVWDIRPASNNQTADMKLLLRDFHALRPLLKRTGCRMHVARRIGLPFRLAKLYKRKFFAAGIGAFFLLLFVLSSLVWNINVVGNEKIPTEDILKAAKEEGVRPYQWIFRLKEPDKLSRALSLKLPETSWIGVERKGTTITIQVVEAEKPEKEPLASPRHLVSKSDAVITSIYAEQGRPLVQKNTRVKKGQVLISGILGDGEARSQVVVAKGEVKGLVWHEYQLEVPLVQKRKIYTGERKDKSYLVLGNRAIQLWGYGKEPFAKSETLTERDPLTWRSIALPIGWMTEKVMEVTETQETLQPEEAKKLGLEAAIRDILAKYGNDSQIISQKILHEKRENGKVYMKVLFEVEEKIAEELPIVQSQGE
ncbi:sporulation protein YqfD [Paenibacillus cookii]|jgi:similar to stage IV sporulation protein|uniref:Sporulation protein YqfD n=1 Tax=Paenibacillus cookii TaxID=157839 RepID=A0ABQ4LR29_9BACL|nr:sporulation protein YqfD [Paenibacillus cookii]KHF33963.1 putative stage IV sporulation protein YqfD [Paenibacillus sp. P1XP2]GIO65593.1 sporulation protein YqfD [Paenibacillus cookii]